MKNLIKITKAKEWELLSHNEFKKIYARVNENTDREQMFKFLINHNNFLEFYDDIEESVKLIKNRSNDYIDNKGCVYGKKGQAYYTEDENVIVIVKDYGFSLSIRLIKK